MNDKTKKVLALIGAGLLIGAVGAGVGATAFPEQVIEEKIVTNTVEVPFETIVTNTVEVPVEVIKEVQVDNGNMDLVLDHIYDNDGNIEYLLDDLDDDEIGLIVDRIIFINDIKKLSAMEADKEIKDLLDKEEFTFNNETIEFDEDDIDRVRVQDDSDDLEILDVDFEDSDAEVKVEVRFEQDDIKYKAYCIVEFKDGKVDDIDLDSVELR